MNLIDRINPFKGSKNKQLDTTLPQSWGNVAWASTSPDHRITALLENCGVSWSDPAAEQWKKLSRILYNNISIYERAIELHSILVGDIMIEGDISEDAKEFAESLLRKLPIFIEQRPFIADTASIEQFKKSLVVDMLRDGIAFAEPRYNDLGEYQGVMVFDTDNFSFELTKFGYELIYLQEQYPQRDENEEPFDTPFFHAVKFDQERGQLWGVPLIRGGRLVADLFTTLLVTTMQQAKRFGNPLSWNFVTQKDLTILESGNPNAAEYVKAIKNIREQLKTGLVNQGKGKGGEIVATAPGDIEIISKTFGEKFTNFIDPDMVWRVAILFCNTLSIPPQLLGIRVGGSGIGSEEFSYMFKILLPRIRSIRNTIYPVLLQEVKNLMYNEGMRPADVEKISLEFSNLDFLNEMDKATVGKTEAETDALRMSLYLDLKSIGEENIAEEYAQRHGLKE